MIYGNPRHIVKECPDAEMRPAYCSLTPFPLQAVAQVIKYSIRKKYPEYLVENMYEIGIKALKI